MALGSCARAGQVRGAVAGTRVSVAVVPNPAAVRKESRVRVVLPRAERLRLFDRHKQFAIWQAAKAKGLPSEDARQEALEGLWRATLDFNASHGVKFISYAAWWIRARLSRMRQKMNGISWRGGDPMVLFSLDAPVSSSPDCRDTHLDMLEDAGPGTEDLMGRAEVSWKIRARLDKLGLSPVERSIMEGRLLRGEDGCTLDAIAGRHDLSRERIRQIQVKLEPKLARMLGEWRD